MTRILIEQYFRILANKLIKGQAGCEIEIVSESKKVDSFIISSLNWKGIRIERRNVSNVCAVSLCWKDQISIQFSIPSFGELLNIQTCEFEIDYQNKVFESGVCNLDKVAVNTHSMQAKFEFTLADAKNALIEKLHIIIRPDKAIKKSLLDTAV